MKTFVCMLIILKDTYCKLLSKFGFVFQFSYRVLRSWDDTYYKTEMSKKDVCGCVYGKRRWN